METVRVGSPVPQPREEFEQTTDAEGFSQALQNDHDGIEGSQPAAQTASDEAPRPPGSGTPRREEIENFRPEHDVSSSSLDSTGHENSSVPPSVHDGIGGQPAAKTASEPSIDKTLFMHPVVIIENNGQRRLLANYLNEDGVPSSSLDSQRHVHSSVPPSVHDGSVHDGVESSQPAAKTASEPSIDKTLFMHPVVIIENNGQRRLLANYLNEDGVPSSSLDVVSQRPVQVAAHQSRFEPTSGASSSRRIVPFSPDLRSSHLDDDYVSKR